MRCDTGAATRLAHDDDIGGIAAERSNVVAHPAERQALVREAVAASGAVITAAVVFRSNRCSSAPEGTSRSEPISQGQPQQRWRSSASDQPSQIVAGQITEGAKA